VNFDELYFVYISGVLDVLFRDIFKGLSEGTPFVQLRRETFFFLRPQFHCPPKVR